MAGPGQHLQAGELVWGSDIAALPAPPSQEGTLLTF